MRSTRPNRWGVIFLAFLNALWPACALAQQSKAGVVTTVQGQAILARPTIPQPIPVKFKDDLFARDRVETKEDSIVRVLLGGKALVTIRELSTFTISEEPGRAAIDLRSGRLAVGVAKSLLAPGEVIQIRTPNAVAGIRGSLLVAEVTVVGGVPQSTFTALQAAVPITIAALAAPTVTVSLSPNQVVGVSGVGAAAVVGPVQNVTPAQAQRAAATVTVARPAEQSASSPLGGQISTNQIAQATQLATLIAPLPAGATPPVAPPPSTANLGVNQTEAAIVAASGPAPIAADVPDVVISNTTVTLPPGETLKTYSGSSTRTGSSAVVQITNSQVTGTADLLEVAPGANATLAGPLLDMTGPSLQASVLTAGARVLDVEGRLSTTGTSALLSFDPTTVISANEVIRVSGGSLDLAGPLLSSVGTNFTVGNPTTNTFSFFSILDGGTVTSTSVSPLLSFDGSSVDSSGNIVSIRRSASPGVPSTLTLSGPLLSAVSGSSFNTSSLGLGAGCCSTVSITQGGRLVGTGTAPLIQLSGATINAGPDAQSGGGFFNLSDTFTNAPAGELVAPSSVSLAGPLLRADGGSVTTLFHLLQVVRSSLTTTSPDPLIQLNNTTVNLGGHDPIANATSTARFLNLVGSSTSPGTLNLKGSLLSATNSNITTTSEPFGIFAGGTLTQTGTADPLISLSGGSLTGGAHFVQARGFATGGSLPASLSLSGTLLRMSGTTMNVSGNVLRLADGGALSSTVSDPLISLTGGSFTGAPAGSGLGGSLLRMFSEIGQAGTSLSIAGPYLVSSGTNYTAPDTAAFNIADGATINSSASGAFASFTGGTLTSASSFVSIDGKTSFTTPGQPPTVGSGVFPVFNLAGPLLSFKDSTVSVGNPTTNTHVLMFVGDSSTLRSTGSGPLFSLDGTHVDVPGGVLSLRRSTSVALPSQITLSGPLLSAVNNSNIDSTSLGFGSAFGVTGAACCDMFFIAQGSQLTSTSSAPLIQLTNSTFNAGPDAQSGGSLVGIFNTFAGVPASELVAPASVALAGPLLKSDGGTITALFSLLDVGRSSLVNSSPDPLIQLDGTTVSLGGTNPFAPSSPTLGRLVTMVSSAIAGTSASPASVSLAGPVLNANNSTLTMTADVVGVFNGASLTSTTSLPLLSLGNTTLTAGISSINGHGLNVNNVGGSGGTVRASVTLSGPLLAASNGSSLNLTGGLFGAFNGGTVTGVGSTDPFVSITGGTHSIATNAGTAMFRLFGRSTATAVEEQTGLTLGTDTPLQRDGVLLETSGATVSGQQIAQIDTAVLAATAPLLNAKAASLLTSSTDAVNLSSRADVSLGSDLIRLDASTLNVTSGSLVKVNASKLIAGGNLVNLVNGATLTLFNGPLITVSGGGFVNITGSLINFGGTGGNKVNITNNLCPCTIVGGVPVALQNGAAAGNVQITNPYKNASLGQVTLSSNAAVAVVNGAGSKLTVKGQ